MSIYTWRSGASAHPEDSVLQYFTDNTLRGGIVASGHFLVSQKSGTPDLSVDVAGGRAYVFNSSLSTNSYPVRSTAIENRSVTSNSSGNPRIDAVVLYIDLSASPNADGTGVAKIQVIAGTPAASPVAPTDSEIFTVIGSSNPFLRLANVTVASGASSILNANISDQRVRVSMTPPSPDPYVHDMSAQALINGDFQIWQRMASFAGPWVDGVAGWIADHWVEVGNDDGGTKPTITRSVQNLTPGDIPGSYTFSRLATNGAGTSLGVNAQQTMGQKVINGVRLLCGDGKKLTVSFWARSSIPGKRMALSMNQWYGTGGSPSGLETLTGQVFSLTSSWTKYTATFTTNTLVGKTFGTSTPDILEIYFWYVWGSSTGAYAGSTTPESYGGSGNTDIAQIQLNAGDYALPFHPKTQWQELNDCQQFYEKSYDLGQFPGIVTGNANWAWEFGVNMNGMMVSVPYKVKKNYFGNVINTITYDVAGNQGKISTKTVALGGFTNNQPVTFVSNYMWGFACFSTQNPIQGMAFHWTADCEV
jgi:hypothetical protein